MVLFEGSQDYIHLAQKEPAEPTLLDANGEAQVTFLPQNGTLDTGSGVIVENNTRSRDICRKPGLCSERTSLEKILLALLFLFGIAILSLIALLVAKTNDGNLISYSDDKSSRGEDGVVLHPGERPSSAPVSKSNAAAQVSKPIEPNVEVCTAAGCVSAAADILAAMDPTTNPCDDFFTYSCGKWNKLHPIPEDEAGYGTFRMVRDKLRVQLRALLKDDWSKNTNNKAIRMARGAYDGCMDEAGILQQGSVPLWQAMNLLGGWPLLNRSAVDARSINMTSMFGRIKKDFAADVFLVMFVYADGKNTTKNVLYVDQGTLGLQAREYYLNKTMFNKQLTGYKNLMKGTIKLLAKDKGVTPPENLDEWIEKLMTFETQLANMTSPEAMRRNATRMYNKWTLGYLEKKVPQINWMYYLQLILPPEVMAIMTKDTEVIVQEPEYLQKMATFIEKADKETVVNYMYWRIVKLWTKVLDTRYEDLIQEFLMVMMGRQRKPPRWKSCVMAAVGWFDMAMGSLYVREHFDTRDKEEALAMIRNLQDAFKGLVATLDWMDNATRQTAIEKAEAMILHIGYPKMVKNLTALDDYYKELSISRDDTYFMMAKKIAVWAQNKELRELLKSFDREKFDISPAVVNAFYSPEKNAITFPAGILQPPFFRGDYPKSVNYGAMGAVIGHEITHGFDDQGSQYDKDGNLQNWWTDVAFNGFYERTQCMIKQYSSYEVPDIKMRVNGDLTQGENIADNGGIKESFQAYNKYIKLLGKEEPRLPGLQNLTNHQIFFLSFANFWCGHKKREAAVQQVLTDPHSPEMFRVIGVMTNSEEFAKAFNCPTSSPMNPRKSHKTKCEVW